MAPEPQPVTLAAAVPAPRAAAERRSAPAPFVALLWRYTPILLLALVWEGATRSGLVSPLVLPALDRVAAAWWDLLVSGDLTHNAAISLARAAAGLGLAVLCGTPLGILMAWFRPIRIACNPLVQALYPMPKSALIPVMVLWLGFGSASKIVL